MSKIQWQKGLFRIYAIYTVILVVVFIPRFITKYRELDRMVQRFEKYATEYADPQWCKERSVWYEKRANESSRSASRAEEYRQDAQNLRDPKWTESKAAFYRKQVRFWRPMLPIGALFRVVPWLLLWCIAPWVLHYVLKFGLGWIFKGFVSNKSIIRQKFL